MFKADLHMHTTASDGALSAKEVINKAKNSNLDIISITDHDTIEISKDTFEYSQKFNIKLIPGIELTTIHNGENVHLLGYFCDDSFKDTGFQNLLSHLKEDRIQRGKNIVKNLKSFFDIDIDFNELLKDSNGLIARPHIAKAIIKSGYDNSFSHIFDTVLSKHSPAYVPNCNFELTEGLKILNSLNAITVIAHPTLLKKNKVEDLMNLDFKGLEIIYPLNKEGEFEYFKKLCQKYNKIYTAGSDFHGITDDLKHGDLGSCYLDGEALDNFLNLF